VKNFDCAVILSVWFSINVDAFEKRCQMTEELHPAIKLKLEQYVLQSTAHPEKHPP
jgi:hypothetical protein